MYFRLGELFCGPGGLAKGALTADIGDDKWKIKHYWASDFDSSTCETYRRNICPGNEDSVICKDVHALDLNKLKPIEALAFGAPCNDFSIIGEKKGIKGKYGHLYSYGVIVLKKFQPLWFLFENVSGIKSANDGHAFEFIQNELKESGYKLYPNLYKFIPAINGWKRG